MTAALHSKGLSSFPPHLAFGAFQQSRRAALADHQHAEQLTLPAVQRTRELLTRFGSTVSEEHAEALHRMISGFTMLATGELSGRYAYSLPCGCGKTVAVRAWCGSLIRSGLRFSVMITASRIEELDDIYRQLVAEGIPTEAVGIIHSEPASQHFTPPTVDNDRRQILIVTHMRLKKDGGLDRDELLYRGRSRDVVLWDEACIVSTSRGIGFESLAGAIGWVEKVASAGEPDAPIVRLSTWASLCWHMIEQEKRAQRDNPRRRPEQLVLPQLSEGEAADFRSVLPNRELLDPLQSLIDIHAEQLRLLGSGQGGGGVLTYTISVPPTLRNVAILDASAHIRELVKEDPTIEVDPWFAERSIKRYSRVAIRHWKMSGGRQKMEEAFGGRREDRLISKEIAALISNTSPDEALVIFTHKKRGKVDMAEVLQADLRAYGIDLDATVPDPAAPGSRLPRFCWLTHGRETASNRYKHCSHVIFIGSVHLSDVAAAGKLVGQRDDLLSEVTHGRIVEVQRSEIANNLYQGIHRGACRDTVDGEAKDSTVHVILWDRKPIELAASLMPGCRIERWSTARQEETTRTTAAVQAISAILDQQPRTINKVSIKSVKAALTVEVSEKAWRLAREQACRASGWKVLGRSFVRS